VNRYADSPIRGKLRQTLRLLVGKPVLDSYILSLNPAKLAQFLPERSHEGRDTGSNAYIKKTYTEDFSRLLRVDQTSDQQDGYK